MIKILFYDWWVAWHCIKSNFTGPSFNDNIKRGRVEATRADEQPPFHSVYANFIQMCSFAISNREYKIHTGKGGFSKKAWIISKYDQLPPIT